MAKNESWTPNEVINLFRIQKTKTALYKDESNGLIPEATRIERGKTYIRSWKLNDLPLIGEKHGFIKKPKSQKIISIYTPKGGVLKTTFSFNLARMLALHNIKVLVIGLDVQCSITNNLMIDLDEEISSLDEIPQYFGLYDAAKNDQSVDIENLIIKSDLNNLHFIPESTSLNLLEQTIRDKTKREYFLSKLLNPIKNDYEIIIFDNSPNWNFLIQNSLAMATDVISPISCDIETYRSLTQNIEMINNFKNNMDLVWNSFTLIPTKLERTKLSTQIEAQYRGLFPDLITSTSIRSASIGQESSLEKVSVIEYDSRSPLADDYYSLMSDLSKIIGF